MQAISKYGFLILAFVFCLTAIRSTGFYHADEHYQLLEFANKKLNPDSPWSLTWEHEAQIRPSLQVAIAVLAITGIKSIGIEDPANHALALRLLTAILAIISIYHFSRSSSQDERKYRISLWIYLLWVIPFISVRFSSETWSGLMLLHALAAGKYFDSLPSKQPNLFLSGIFLGLAFAFRYQSAIFGIALTAWLFLIKKPPIKHVLQLIAGIAIPVLLGIISDRWFYEEWVLSPWRYFQANILDGAASNFGTSPWWFYPHKMLMAPHWSIGILVVLALAILIAFKPKNLILWLVTTYIIIHSAIPHKEIRFLFPIVFFIPYLLLEAWKTLSNKFNKIGLRRKSWRYLIATALIGIAAINTVHLSAIVSKPAGMGQARILQTLENQYANQDLNLIVTPFSNPYDPWGHMPLYFYNSDDLTTARISELSHLHDSIRNPAKKDILICRRFDLNYHDGQKHLANHGLILQAQSIPPWILWLQEFAGYKPSDGLYVFTWEGF